MQFKHPELLYFLFLLVIPILVHLFQLRKFKKEYFSNVKFLKELALQTRKSSKIKKYLLLATRLLLLACVIFAFTQPFFKAKDSENAQNELYIILDNSFSMQAKGKKGELLKRAVQELLQHAPENANFSLLTCTDDYWNTDIKTIQKELQNLAYSPISFDIESLLAKIKSHKTANKKDIVVITDAVGIKNDALKCYKNDENLFFIVPEIEKKSNVAIDTVYLNQTLDKFYEISVKIKSFDTDNTVNVPVSLYNNNKLQAKTLVNLKTSENKINFTLPKENFNGYVSLLDDGLEYDNTYYFSISKPEKNKVISIGDGAKSEFLSRIYTNDEFIYKNYPLAQLDYNILDKQDAIILNELKEIPVALQTNLKSFAQKGGNVIIIPNAESVASNLNTLTQNWGGITYQSPTTNEKLISKINFNHPLFTGVFEKKVDNFQYPKTNISFEINGAIPSALQYNDATSFLSVFSNGLASVYAFAAPINKTNSNFQNSPIIVPVFYNMAKNIQKTGATAITIGNNTPYIVETDLGKDEIVSVKSNEPQNKESFIPVQQILNNKAKLTFNENPNKAGNYSIYNNTTAIENLSFNYNRKESNLEDVNKDAVSDFKEFNDVETLFNTLHINRTDSMVWKWFVLLALLFLALEIAIQKFVK